MQSIPKLLTEVYVTLHFKHIEGENTHLRLRRTLYFMLLKSYFIFHLATVLSVLKALLLNADITDPHWIRNPSPNLLVTLEIKLSLCFHNLYIIRIKQNTYM